MHSQSLLAASAALLGSVQASGQNILYSPDNYQFNPLEHLAGIAPYFSPQDPPLSPATPQGCNVTRAAYLVRHAAIYANDFDYESYIQPFTEKLANTSADFSKSHDLSFLSTWVDPIDEDRDMEQLTKIGSLEAMSLGVELARRYPGFATPKKVWTSTAERTVKSAQSLISGLDRTSNLSALTQIGETSESGADSLTPYKGCPAYSSSRGSDQSSTFQKKYTAPIIARFRAAVPGFNWTASDIYGMQQLCGYESVIRGTSPFCSTTLFTPDEWLGFEYTNDLMYHHNTGYGNPISAVLGYPWVNATAATLFSSTNASGAAQDLYVSFTHRELPPTVLVALGLFNNSAFSGADDANASMPLDAVNHRRAWKSSHILPFLTNIAVERMACDSYGFEDAGDEFYRVLVNSAPQPLQGCVDGPGESCARASFERWVRERGERFGGFGEKCGVDYDNSTDVLGIYQA
ncbi:Histidine phosphatase superfamily clade-2 [Neofusicoccum parvum]|uniref:Histidine phosphatase superfamily clade-2 n=1 Tax=Neofusicoccum parvum TaxID=310453 RepID=A0ACB5SA17_9PEZI|nr:Histidine phosphatase superfamily clade-2 [Neofusicoccum parvum]